MSSGHSLYHLIGVNEHFQYVAAAGATGALLVGAGIYVRNKCSRMKDDVLPEPKISVFNLMVEVIAYFRNLLHTLIGPHADKYLPIVVSTFILIFLSNLSGLFPALLSTSTNLNNNLAMALFVFVAYNFFGFREHGPLYLLHMTGLSHLKSLLPKNRSIIFSVAIGAMVAALGLLVMSLELVSHFFRPVTLSLRLWGVMNADHILEGVVSGMVPYFLPMLAMGLGLIVCLVQAFVFSLLSTVYIQMAVSHDH